MTVILLPPSLRPKAMGYSSQSRFCQPASSRWSRSDADAAGAGGALSQGASGQQDPGDGAKGIEAPLVVGGGEGRHEVGDDPSPRQEDVEDDGGPRDARQQAQRQDDGGERHDPVDVLAVEDLAGGTVVGDVGLADDQEAEIRGLGEVGDGADQEGDGVQVVKIFSPERATKERPKKTTYVEGG